MDYSQKYGFTYLLSNGTSGELFNDFSSVVESPNGRFVDFHERGNSFLRSRSAKYEAFCGDKKRKLHEYFKQRI